jgi:uncharacterized membrane protein
MSRLLFSLGVGLVLGGIIHIVTVLGIPRFAVNDAWARIAIFGPNLKFNLVPSTATGVQPLPLLDPAFVHATCRFGLTNAPVRIRATLPDTYWTMAIYDRRGVNLYNLNDRGTGQKPVDLLVATAEQISQIRENPPDDFNDIIIVDWASNEGFAVIRIFASGASETADAQAAIAQARCEPNPIQ